MAVTPHAVWGAKRLVEGYSGPLFRLRNSGGAEQDFAAVGGDLPDYVAVASFAGEVAPTVTTIYDQTGNGRHQVQTTVAQQPILDAEYPIEGGVWPIVFDGQPSTEGTTIFKSLLLQGQALDRQNLSAFVCTQPLTTWNKNTFLEAAAADLTTKVVSLESASNRVLFDTGSQFASLAANGAGPNVNLNTIGFSISPTTKQVFLNQTGRTLAQATTSLAAPVVRLGTSVALTNGAGRHKLVAAAIYNTAVDQATGFAIAASLDAACSVWTGPEYNLVMDGDSIMRGAYSTQLRNVVNQMRPLLTLRPLIYNTAVYGTTLAVINSQRTSRYPELYSSARQSVIFLEAGTNDLGNSTAGATLYTDTLSPLIAYLKGLGFKVVAVTILPRTGGTWNSTKEAERVAYNNLIRANSAGADAICDWAGDPVMGDAAAPSNTTLYADGLHPADAGFQILAGLCRNTLQTVLGFAP